MPSCCNLRLRDRYRLQRACVLHYTLPALCSSADGEALHRSKPALDAGASAVSRPLMYSPNDLEGHRYASRPFHRAFIGLAAQRPCDRLTLKVLSKQDGSGYNTLYSGYNESQCPLRYKLGDCNRSLALHGTSIHETSDRLVTCNSFSMTRFPSGRTRPHHGVAGIQRLSGTTLPAAT